MLPDLKNTGMVFIGENFSESVKENLEKFVRDAGAFSPNTWSAMFSVMRKWARWCQVRAVPYLPVNPEMMRLYLLELSETGSASSTVRMHYAMLNMVHVRAGLPKPGDDNAVQLVMRRIGRESVQNGEETGQAVPFRKHDLIAVCRVLDEMECLRNLRDAAFLHIAYTTLLRISELGRIKVRDIQLDRGRAVIRIGYTKTQVTAAGLMKKLSTASTKRLQSWLDRSGLSVEPEAYIFCKVDKSDKAIMKTDKPMSRQNLESIFESAWKKTYPGERCQENKDRYAMWSGHSARVGAAQDMAIAGVALPRIMQAGNWSKPETVLRYLRNILADDNPLLQLMEGDHELK